MSGEGHGSGKNVWATLHVCQSFGALAQLGERLICIQEVRSSILLGSTIKSGRLRRQNRSGGSILGFDAKREARGSPCCSRRRPVFRYQDPSADCTGEPRSGFSRPIGQLRGSAAFDIVQRDTTSELPIPRVRGDQLPVGLRAGPERQGSFVPSQVH